MLYVAWNDSVGSPRERGETTNQTLETGVLAMKSLLICPGPGVRRRRRCFRRLAQRGAGLR